jgi:hypothetical protein
MLVAEAEQEIKVQQVLAEQAVVGMGIDQEEAFLEQLIQVVEVEVEVQVLEVVGVQV